MGRKGEEGRGKVWEERERRGEGRVCYDARSMLFHGMMLDQCYSML